MRKRCCVWMLVRAAYESHLMMEAIVAVLRVSSRTRQSTWLEDCCNILEQSKPIICIEISIQLIIIKLRGRRINSERKSSFDIETQKSDDKRIFKILTIFTPSQVVCATPAKTSLKFNFCVGVLASQMSFSCGAQHCWLKNGCASQSLFSGRI